MDSNIFKHAQFLWDYLKLDQPLRKADCLLVMGSHDLRVAEYGAKLCLEGWAPLVIFSGGLGNLTRGIWQEPEAERFARIAREKGVPAEKILIENQSTNTGENIVFTRELLKSRGIDPQSFILIHKPYMERRALATFQKLWPGKDARVSSPQIDMLDYPTDEISLEDMINIMVGDFQRILIYPQRGFQLPQPVTGEVKQAYKSLIELGFNKHLIKEIA